MEDLSFNQAQKTEQVLAGKYMFSTPVMVLKTPLTQHTKIHGRCTNENATKLGTSMPSKLSSQFSAAQSPNSDSSKKINNKGHQNLNIKLQFTGLKMDHHSREMRDS